MVMENVLSQLILEKQEEVPKVLLLCKFQREWSINRCCPVNDDDELMLISDKGCWLELEYLK